MAKFEFIVIGIGLNNGIASKGVLCPDGGCAKGVPNLKFEDDSVYAHDGYKKIQGPAQPLILGGSRFATEAQADKWLLTKDGIRFKDVFLNVFIARVTA
ncbi:MAG: hypothetical protein ABI831_22135 [Betaproteobacteria bacterium]